MSPREGVGLRRVLTRRSINKDDLADPKKREYMEGRIPLGRLGMPIDLAGVSVHCARAV